jgi:hypothetical protein
LEVIIKSKSEGKPACGKKGKANSCKFGNSTASFSPYYTADGVNLAMPEGYPTLTNTGNKNTFRFRFANFKTNIHAATTIMKLSRKGTALQKDNLYSDTWLALLNTLE